MLINTIWQSVFAPKLFQKNPKGELVVNKYGWIFIGVRWLYYSILFSLFRDYSGEWKPFVPPPFNLSLETYALLQRYFSVIFGFFLMFSIAIALWTYIKIIGKDIPLFKILNILGITFFLPFIILQPIDRLVIISFGWTMPLITFLHTLFLLWEGIAAVLIIDNICKLKVSVKITSVFIITAIWIFICGIFWR